MRQAIIDTGSNTIVLTIYSMNGTIPQCERYESVTAHLIDHIKDGRITEEGLSVLSETIQTYRDILSEEQVNSVRACVTEPWRSASVNCEAIRNVFHHYSVPCAFLNGEEEALCEFYGSAIDTDIHPLTIDIGGGSTELIFAENQRPVETISIPLGCVRLAHVDDPLEASRQKLSSIRLQHPSFPDTPIITGMGGTIRAAGLCIRQLYGENGIISSESLNDFYDRLQNDKETISVVRTLVTSQRYDVILSGLSMLKGVTEVFHVSHIAVSQFGVREGFLLRYNQIKEKNCRNLL